MAWPARIKAQGEIRHQYCHAVDIVPTLYECLGIDPPDEVRGYTQSRIEGVSIAHTFEDADAPTHKRAQFYSMLGTRGIWCQGWHASTVHPAMGGWGGFDRDRWELFHMDQDRNQMVDLAEKHPGKLEELKSLWAMLAGAYQGLPLDDRTAVEVLAEPRPQPGRPRSRYVYYPDCEPVPMAVGVSTTQRSFDISADVDVHDGHPAGVIFAQGAHNGGHTLYVQDGRVRYVYNWLGEMQQKVESSEPLPGGRHTVRVTFDVEDHDKKNMSPIGPARLFIDGKEVGSERIRTQPGMFGLEGVVTVGRDTGRPASDDYRSPDAFHGGQVDKVTVTVRGKPHRDPEKQAEMARRRD